MDKIIRSGAYKCDITPPLGGCIAGSYSIIRSARILDKIYAHALVVDDGKTEAAIISVDVCSITDKNIYMKITQNISEFCGIPASNILVAATHTHSGPLLFSPIPEVFGEVDKCYVDYFIKQIVTAVRMAQQRKCPAKLSAGKGRNPNCVFNRRLQKPDGSIVMNWVDQDFLKDCMPSGVADDEMLVCSIEGEEGKTIAILVNFANHNNAAGDAISADMVGVMRDILYKVYGDDMVVIFLLGACGNTNWINHKDSRRFNPDYYKKLGTSLAGTAIEIMGRLESLKVPFIRVEREILKVWERPYSDYDVKEDDTFGPKEGSSAKSREEFFLAYRINREKYGDLPLQQYELPLQVIALGGQFAVSTNPAELFCEYGIRIKEKSPFKYTMVSELTNGECGYVPTPEAFQQGGYEVRKIKPYSYLETEAGEKIALASLEMLKKCKKSFLK
ncbi:MAG: neutral/alkaline non-lysosomal ceramidase N-terminal domain-containing protein [Clostridia bacterium]|nr:neutral/alkaline non-lysosomal ceramidase N-terminal domain-containing protein [Clostridia bacterium]